MKIGVGLTMMDRQYPGYLDSLVKYSEIGYDVLDYSMYSEGEGSIFLQDGWQAYAEKLREVADKHNLWFAQMHSPGMGPVGREPMEEVKLELTKRAFEFCSILGTNILWSIRECSQMEFTDRIRSAFWSITSSSMGACCPMRENIM
ncbi:MAG: hypothetical protein ACLR23_27935 [Clostridia bacterium]